MGVPKQQPADEEESLGEALRRIQSLACDGPIPEPAPVPNVEDLLRSLGEQVGGGED